MCRLPKNLGVGKSRQVLCWKDERDVRKLVRFWKFRKGLTSHNRESCAWRKVALSLKVLAESWTGSCSVVNVGA